MTEKRGEEREAPRPSVDWLVEEAKKLPAKKWLEFWREVQRVNLEVVSASLNDLVREQVRRHMPPDDKDYHGIYSCKKIIAKLVNLTLRQHAVSIAQPETGEACYLVAINDEYGGKFALESKKTKKRSMTTRDIEKLLPFMLIPFDD